MKRLQIALCVVMLTLMSAKAQNPVVQTCYTGDPALMASGDRMYLYVGHDEDKADFFWMYEWRCYSSSDMVNWTDHGSPLNLSAFEWADDRAWASQTIEGFRAPNFKERDKSTKYEDCYTEGPWIMKRNVYPVNKKGKTAKKPVWLYYLLYAAGGIPEHISYSTAPTPEGPWAYRGNIMPLEETKSFTNHCVTRISSIIRVSCLAVVVSDAAQPWRSLPTMPTVHSQSFIILMRV